MDKLTLAARLRAITGAISAEVTVGDSSDPLTAAADALATLGRDEAAWLALAVLRARLPLADEVIDYRRHAAIDGHAAAMTAVSAHAHGPAIASEVVVVTDAVVVDVHHTARTGLATGIQRVVRRTIAQWDETREIELVGWDTHYEALTVLTPSQRRNAIHGDEPASAPAKKHVVLVPWRSHYVLPELATEASRTARIRALAEFSGNTTGAIGFDCVPLSTAETVGDGMGAAFAGNLVALARMHRIAAISHAAKTEYAGWAAMLPSAGITAPDITAISLAADVPPVTTVERDDSALPLLLCVGSHEPRKNHLAVLEACEELWQAGREFRLLFVGGNAWNSGAFSALLGELARLGRTVVAKSAVSDAELFAAYRTATASVFPSLNEGFGLPIVESLAAGTPVVTSEFGSMREIAEGNGAVLVNPRDEAAIARAIDSVLFDAKVQATLRAQAATFTPRSWPSYADALWDYFIGA